MLSRVADNLYWMSRYLERAEHTARLIDVSLFHLLDQNSEYAMQHWKRLFDSLRIPGGQSIPEGAYNVAQELMFDASNSSSLLSCIDSARDNARQVREQITTEMWEQLNRLYLHVKQESMEDVWFAEPHEFLTNVKESIQLFQGLTDSTMSCNEGWYFIRVGRSIERARATAALIDTHFRPSALDPSREEEKKGQKDKTDNTQSDHLDYLAWVGLLRSCSAFDAYRKVYTADVRPERIAEFLILNPESPRSIRFAISVVQNSLQAIAKGTNAHHAQRAERLVGRLRASLEYDQIEDIMNNIHAYLERIEQQCTLIHNALYQTYIFYPIEIALISEVGASQS
jgi:uncharacterized alpha-E superfamily protein